MRMELRIEADDGIGVKIEVRLGVGARGDENDTQTACYMTHNVSVGGVGATEKK